MTNSPPHFCDPYQGRIERVSGLPWAASAGGELAHVYYLSAFQAAFGHGAKPTETDLHPGRLCAVPAVAPTVACSTLIAWSAWRIMWSGETPSRGLAPLRFNWTLSEDSSTVAGAPGGDRRATETTVYTAVFRQIPASISETGTILVVNLDRFTQHQRESHRRFTDQG